MPHLHLSLQAGDDLILKRMKRRHSRADAIAFCAELRRLRPGIALGADLIAGFPTEDEAMFARTHALIAECGIAYAHIFPFSPRQGTPAARMPQLARQIVRERAALLRAEGERVRAAFFASTVGTTTRGLVESAQLLRTDAYAPLRLEGPAVPGTVIAARVTGATSEHLTGVAA